LAGIPANAAARYSDQGLVFLGTVVVVDISQVLLFGPSLLTIEDPAIVMGKRHHGHIRHPTAAVRVRPAARFLL
jgi:hypothetical protein